MSDILKINADEGRFSRFELVSWWDQDRLANAKVLVIGAGAIGNEVIKNLALLGVGNVFVADLDIIEHSNLSRSVLFRYEDCGSSKAETIARRAVEIYPDMRVTPFHSNVVYDLGLGVYDWADVIIGALDNREARVAINQAAARVGRIWIDGAIELLSGVARVFNPGTGPCYECTMNETDWKMLEARRSCALLSRDEMEQGKVPTTPTTASVIAGIQVQEAVKFLHGMPTLDGQGFIFEGLTHQSYQVTYTQRDDCLSHEAYEPIERLDWSTSQTTVGQLLDRVRSDINDKAVIEFNHDMLASLHCPACGTTEPLLTSMGKVTESQGRCPNPQCNQPRQPNMYHTINGSESFLEKSLAEIGVPRWDIIGGRSGLTQRFYAFDGDRPTVIPPHPTTTTTITPTSS